MKTLKSVVTLIPMISIFLVIVGYFSLNYSVYINYYEYINDIVFTLMFNAMVIFIAFYYNLCPSTKVASISFSVFGVLNIINKIFEIEIYYYPMFRVSVLTVIFIYSIIIFIKKWLKQ